MEFKGTKTPEIYIISPEATDHDRAIGYPCTGADGDFLCSLFGSFGKFGDIRFGCWKEQGARVVADDIVNKNPKVIVGIGDYLAEALCGIKKTIKGASGTVSTVYFHGKPFPYVSVMSPISMIEETVPKKKEVLAYKIARDIEKSVQIADGTYRDLYEEKKLMSAHSYKEFVDIYNKEFKDEKLLGYDIETNAMPPMTEGSAIIGFSVGTPDRGVYVSVSSLDFTMPKEDEDSLWDFVIKDVFEKEGRSLIIHNTMYERPYTYCCKGYEIPYNKAEDTLVLARMLKNPKEDATLKYQAQKYLDFPDWETDLQIYVEAFKKAVDRIFFGPKKYLAIYEELMAKRNIFSLESFESYKALSGKTADADRQELSEIVHGLYDVCLGLYSEEELEKIGCLIVDKMCYCKEQGGIKNVVWAASKKKYTIPYNYVPDRILSKYGAMDSVATCCLFDYFNEIMNRDSTATVDLHKGYRNWLEHMYVAYIMEKNGMNWNEDLVKKDEALLTKQSIECLRSLLMSPVFKSHIYEVCLERYKPLILAEYLPEIAEALGLVVSYDKEDKTYSIAEKGGSVCSKTILSTITIPDAYKESCSQIVESLFYEEVESASSYDELKELLNPSSAETKELLEKILITDEAKMGARINALSKIMDSPDYEDMKPTLSFLEEKFLKLASVLVDTDELKSRFGGEWANKQKELYEAFCVLYKSERKNVANKEIKAVLSKKEPLVVESFDDEGIISVYNSYIVTGIDPDNRATWTPVFEWMVNFRICKKSIKLLTTYINGSVGRQSVYVVDKDKLSSGGLLVRKRMYEPKVKDSEAYLLAAKWSPNTANTGRWRSGFHTIPWDSPIKRYYSSRFVGGTTLCPDYAQMEVRTLAAVSKDENMLNVFRSGKDFHGETAKKIFKKEEVTSAERRFSKSATFSLLYGSSVNSFAKKYCKGDLAYANKIFDGFFEAYPDVRRWIEERHLEAQKDHRVSLELSNRFIPIEQEGHGQGALNALLRKAQNYPIQSQSADLTGGVIFDLQQYIEDNKMKSAIFMYVHDSIEVDVFPTELLKLVVHMQDLLNEAPKRRMGLPSHADVALGKSLGHEIELKSIECNADFTEGVLRLKGYRDEIEETVENWKKAYSIVEMSEESWEEEFESLGELFIPKKAFSLHSGITREKGTCTVKISY